MTAVFPEGMTDPDERDRWLEARDNRSLDTARDSLDKAVMAEVPPCRYHPADDPVMAKEIHARRLYGELWFWQRWFRPAPTGWRTPATGVVHK